MELAPSHYLFVANALLVSHLLFVAFVVFGLLAVYVGHWLSWEWVKNFWFRIVHLASIAFVVLESWFGVICPLTEWEMRLREMAGVETYSGAFIQHWLQSLLYFQAPAWVFVLCYTLFGGLVLASWFIVPPAGRDK